MSLLNSLLNATIKQRRAGSHAVYALANRIVNAYRNHDVDIDSNGEAWLIGRMAQQQGLIAVDVGANRGEWSQCVLTLGNLERLYAYEAVPSTFCLLQQAITDQRFEPVNAALSDSSGSLVIQEYLDKPELASLHADYSDDSAVTDVTIEARTGDEEIARLGLERIHLLKVDTEGHDHAVLAGYKSAIDAGRIDVIQFEYNYTTLIADKSLKMFFDLLGANYLLCRLLPHGLEACAYHPVLDDFTQANWIAIRRGLVDEAAVRHFNICPARGIVLRDLKRELAGDERLRKIILG